MIQNTTYVLIHSPLVGTLTWELVAEQMRQRGLNAVVPVMKDSPISSEPYWKQHAESIASSLADLDREVPLTFVAHSGAGPLLPAIRQAIPNPVHAYVFVDAGIPQDGASRLELMMAEDSNWAQEFQSYLESGGKFPNWSFEDLGEILPDPQLRRQMIAELHPRGLDFFTEPIPVFDGWPDAPCAYILFSPPYQSAEELARRMGWLTAVMEAGHFHMLVDAKTVTDRIVNTVNEISTTPHD